MDKPKILGICDAHLAVSALSIDPSPHKGASNGVVQAIISKPTVSNVRVRCASRKKVCADLDALTQVGHKSVKPASGKRISVIKEWTCPICHRLFKSPSTSTFRRHERIHQKSTVEWGSCDVCDTKFLSREALNRHFRRKVCYDYATGERRQVAQRYTNIKNTETEGFRCTQCSVSCNSKISLQEHVTRIHEEKVKWKVDGPPYICNICGWDFERFLAFRRHIKAHDAGRFDCRVCRKKFKNRESLVEHIRGAPCSPVHHCPMCNLEFGSKLLRDRHLNNDHTHICPQCGDKFNSYGLLHKHIKVHKPKVCEVCGFVAKSHNQIKKHRETHLVNQRWFCKMCGAGFTAESSRNRHQELKKCTRAASRNKLLPFRCMVCGTHIGTKEILVKHLLAKHEMKVSAEELTLFTCQTCGIEFGRVEVYNQHLLSHAINNEQHEKGIQRAISVESSLPVDDSLNSNSNIVDQDCNPSFTHIKQEIHDNTLEMIHSETDFDTCSLMDQSSSCSSIVRTGDASDWANIKQEDCQ